MRKNRLLAFCLAGCLLLALCACANTNESTQAGDSSTSNTEAQTEVQYDYQLKAGETTEVYGVTFDKMVTVTVDPASTRDGAIDLRSNIFFDNCTFNGGLTIVGDYHAMVSLGADCTFGDNSIVTCKEVTSGVSKEIVLEDNLLKVFVSCEGVCVDTESAIGVITDGPDIIFNGTSYSKSELAPDTAFLGVYSIYEGDTITYPKLAIGEDDSVTFLD
ncbi:MAG: hypothetical protein ACOX60_11115 [Massiliimalia sp.]|jgi:hypothetical protein